MNDLLQAKSLLDQTDPSQKSAPGSAAGRSSSPAPLHGGKPQTLAGSSHSWPGSSQRSLSATPQPGPDHGAPLKSNAPTSESPSGQRTRVAIKTKGRILLLNPSDIVAVEAEGNYVLLRLRADSHFLRESISSLSEKLKDYGFVRVHRSVLVNASWVEEIRPTSNGEYSLRVTGGGQYTVSRTYKPNLKWLAQSWIGIDFFPKE